MVKIYAFLQQLRHALVIGCMATLLWLQFLPMAHAFPGTHKSADRQIDFSDQADVSRKDAPSFQGRVVNGQPDNELRNSRLADKTYQKVNKTVHQSDSQRPKNTKEWMDEAHQDVPLGQRVKDIGEDSAEAVRDWGSVYPDTAKRSGRELRD